MRFGSVFTLGVALALTHTVATAQLVQLDIEGIVSDPRNDFVLDQTFPDETFSLEIAFDTTIPLTSLQNGLLTFDPPISSFTFNFQGITYASPFPAIVDIRNFGTFIDGDFVLNDDNIDSVEVFIFVEEIFRDEDVDDNIAPANTIILGLGGPESAGILFDGDQVLQETLLASVVAGVEIQVDEGIGIEGFGVAAGVGESTSFTATLIPEPTTAAVIGLGSLALLGRRRIA